MMDRLILPARLIFGVWMLLNGLSHFYGAFMPAPTGTQALAVQFIEALHFSRLMDVAMGIQLAAGALVLAGLFTPLALCVVMPVNVCALYWAMALEGDPLWSLLALLGVGLGAFLMLAHLHNYAAMLGRRPLAIGESDTNGGRYETLYTNPIGRTGLGGFALAVPPLIGAALFYHYKVPAMMALYCMLALLIPAGVLVLRMVQGLLIKPEQGG